MGRSTSNRNCLVPGTPAQVRQNRECCQECCTRCPSWIRPSRISAKIHGIVELYALRNRHLLIISLSRPTEDYRGSVKTPGGIVASGVRNRKSCQTGLRGRTSQRVRHPSSLVRPPNPLVERKKPAAAEVARRPLRDRLAEIPLGMRD